MIGDMTKQQKPLRLLLDTNVLVAASRSSLGASFQVLRALEAGQFVALVSVPLMLEYEAVLSRDAQLAVAQRTLPEVGSFLDAFALRSEPVQLHFLWRPQLRDPGDEMVLETALNGRADALVTLNVADFAAAAAFQMRVATPAQCLSILKE